MAQDFAYAVANARSLTIRGAAGAIRWSYHTAGTLRDWTIVRDETRTMTLIATIVSVDHFKASQQPLKFVASNGWTWPIDTLQMTGASLTAVLGSKE